MQIVIVMLMAQQHTWHCGHVTSTENKTLAGLVFVRVKRYRNITLAHFIIYTKWLIADKPRHSALSPLGLVSSVGSIQFSPQHFNGPSSSQDLSWAYDCVCVLLWLVVMVTCRYRNVRGAQLDCCSYKAEVGMIRKTAFIWVLNRMSPDCLPWDAPLDKHRNWGILREREELSICPEFRLGNCRVCHYNLLSRPFSPSPTFICAPLTLWHVSGVRTPGPVSGK